MSCEPETTMQAAQLLHNCHNRLIAKLRVPVGWSAILPLSENRIVYGWPVGRPELFNLSQFQFPRVSSTAPDETSGTRR